ncbi:YfhO family protein [Oscillibacter ruminantium]|uniref:YfhO family protein n=1 Tax=Oscillibacter ruminantium TaxID=1263547 RepID=UPI00332C7687
MNIWGKLRKKEALWLFLAYCAVLFALYAKYFFANQLIMSGDALQVLSDGFLFKAGISEGELPLWNKYLSGGIPFATSLSPTMLLDFLPLKAKVYLSYIGFVAAGAAFVYLYLKEIKCGKWAALSVSVCYLFSTHIGGARKDHIHLIFAMALLPVILYLIERYFSTRKLRWLLASSVVMAFQFSVGFTQHVAYTDIFLAAYLLAFGFHYRMPLTRMLQHGALWIGTYLALILWKIVPLAQEISFYKGMGATSNTLDYFTTNSVHVIKLLMTVFPRIFGKDAYTTFGLTFSSENDLELFLGQITVILVLFAVAVLWKNFRVRFAAVTMVVTFCYAGMGNIPGLSEIVIRIPLLNGFRVPSRILFLFLFSAYTIAAIALSSLRQEALFQKFRKWNLVFCGGCLLLVCGAVLSCMMMLGISSGFTLDALLPLYQYVRGNLLRDCVLLAACMAAVTVLWRLRKKFARQLQALLCTAVALLTVIATLPYMRVTAATDASAGQITDETTARLKEELGDGKVWDALLPQDAVAMYNWSALAFNISTSKEIASLNSYIPMNNLNLYRMMTQGESAPLNHTGLMIYNKSADVDLHMQNSLLSMLGVRYILDSSGLVAADQNYYALSGSEQILLEKPIVELPYLGGAMSLYQEPVVLKPNTYYRFQLDCFASESQVIYSDFWGDGYDFVEQDCTFNAVAGENHFSAIINSGDISVATAGIFSRIFAPLTNEVSISNFQISELETQVEENVYTYWNSINGTEVYINQDARDVLYVPEQIESIADYEDLYNNACLYQLDRVNYSTDFTPRTLNSDAVQISNIDFAYNDITATVDTSEDTFVNFSQCYYPGWKAYVDGEETELHMVNGLIMGMEVPAGTHAIQFAYQPTVIYLGFAVSGISALVLIGAWFFTVKRKKAPSPTNADKMSPTSNERKEKSL